MALEIGYLKVVETKMTKYLEVFKNKSVVVTGHTGFKGSWLSLWLTKLGANVVGIADCIPTAPSHFCYIDLGNEIDDRRIDIRDAKKVEATLQEIKPDFVFHLAAQPLVRNSYLDPVKTWQTNAFGTINLLDGLRKLDHFCTAVMITSDKCYDNVEWVWGYKETDALGGPDPYSASKGAAELAIRSYVKSYFSRNESIRIGIGRAGNVIGGGDWAIDRIIPDCIRAWAEGDIVSLRNPHSTRPWQHVLEPLSGYLNLAVELSIQDRLHGEPFNFGPSSMTDQSVGALVQTMCNQWDKAVWEDISDDNTGPYESGLLKLNCDKALHFLKWHSVWGFERTVKETMDWYKEFYSEKVKIDSCFSCTQIETYTKSAKSLGLPWAQ